MRKALEIKEDYAPAANNLAFLLSEEMVDLNEALKLARTVKGKNPGNPNYLDTLGWIYYQQGSYALALHELTNSLAVNPDNPMSNYHIGWAYYDTGKFEKAREHMAIALKLDPDFEGADQARSIIGE